MSGNLCRCGAYNNIVAAILDVSEPAEAAEAAEVGDAGARP
jgi:xanthine dehydrogenase YagT iron-sulfur-binding subunit